VRIHTKIQRATPYSLCNYLACVCLVSVAFAEARYPIPSRIVRDSDDPTHEANVNLVKSMTVDERTAYVVKCLKTQVRQIDVAQVVDRSCFSHRCTCCLSAKKYVVPRDTIETSAESDRASTRSSFRRSFSILGLLGGVDHSLPMCAICLDIFEEGDTVCSSQNKLCLHQFHVECAFEWLLKSQECPCCRRDYLTAGEDNFDVETGWVGVMPVGL
jgi:Ring finger domain